MKRVIMVFIVLIVLAFSCNDHEIDNTDTFEVTVAGANCGLILIDFNEGDLGRIKNITGSDWSRYRAYNLDDRFSEIGQKLIVFVRKTKDDELHPCTTMEPGYPWVTVIKAELGDGSTITACNDTLPTTELCDAYYKTWFYDKTTSSCVQIEYSGCSMKGFETKEKCESCKNNNVTGG
ncbi:MAG: hypothetical protein KF845_03910 [Cyclobacteriaceae bacterium]|nr:hypothetical protein [Cyclobacteriaceae bacterium]